MSEIVTEHIPGFEHVHPRIFGALKIVLGVAAVVLPCAIWQVGASAHMLSVDSPVVPIFWALVFLVSLFHKGWRLVALGMTLGVVFGGIIAVLVLLLFSGFGPVPAG